MIRRRAKVIVLVLLLAVAVAAVPFVRLMRYGFSAKDEPSRVEHILARAMRDLAVPSDLRSRKNPVKLTPGVLAEARAHFADHCAPCHGNDGTGRTAMGPNFYPKVPDMTLQETQSQSDGALFATIENGIRLTGMPAWGNGTAESAYGSWTLVHFIRHLPRITPEELAEMEQLNPKTPGEWAAMQEEKEFLEGAESSQGKEQTAVPTHHH